MAELTPEQIVDIIKKSQNGERIEISNRLAILEELFKEKWNSHDAMHLDLKEQVRGIFKAINEIKDFSAGCKTQINKEVDDKLKAVDSKLVTWLGIWTFVIAGIGVSIGLYF